MFIKRSLWNVPLLFNFCYFLTALVLFGIECQRGPSRTNFLFTIVRECASNGTEFCWWVVFLFLKQWVWELVFNKKKKDYLTTILKWQREFNRQIFRVWIAGQHYSVFTKPEDMEVILTSTEILLKKDVYDYLRPWLGDGLLTSGSTKWHKHRKIITPSFHFQILKEFLDTMNKTSNKFVGKLESAAKNEQIIDIQELVHKCTLDIISGRKWF